MVDDEPGDGSVSVRTLYGRRKGKKLRLHQAELMNDALPRLSIDCSSVIANPRALFAGVCESVRVEIGFGGAEHLVHEALTHPTFGYIGCEPFLNGVAKLLVQVEEHDLQNVRVHHGDARDVLGRLPDGSVDRVDVLYPDPWPKWRQRKRRFLSSRNIEEIGRILKTGGVFRFATDIDDYAGWVLARTIRNRRWLWQESRSGERSWTEAWPGWPGTRYEAKAHREGRKPVYLSFVRQPDQDSSTP